MANAAVCVLAAVVLTGLTPSPASRQSASARFAERNLYCRCVCSLGAALGVISNLTVFRIKRWNECQTCKICENACQWGAIRGPKIVASECVRCDDCERIYADEHQGVHWILLRKKGSREKPPQFGAPL